MVTTQHLGNDALWCWNIEFSWVILEGGPGSFYPWFGRRLVGIIMVAALYNSPVSNPSPGEVLVLDILVLSWFNTPTLIKEITKYTGCISDISFTLEHPLKL